MHLNQLVDEIVKSVSNIRVVQGQCIMEVMKSGDFTKEQKIVLVRLMSPTDAAISNAQNSFIFSK